jgi:hypothetical protein
MYWNLNQKIVVHPSRRYDVKDGAIAMRFELTTLQIDLPSKAPVLDNFLADVRLSSDLCFQWMPPAAKPATARGRDKFACNLKSRFLCFTHEFPTNTPRSLRDCPYV